MAAWTAGTFSLAMTSSALARLAMATAQPKETVDLEIGSFPGGFMAASELFRKQSHFHPHGDDGTMPFDHQPQQRDQAGHPEHEPAGFAHGQEVIGGSN